MSNPVISVRGLGKKYRLGATHRYDSLRDQITNTFKSLFSRNGNKTGADPTKVDNRMNDAKEFWALRDISIDIEQGEIIGIIGPNGAGKSTLLKILSEITEPTVGEIRIRGQVGTLLEVGTGFHPELSGRENIFLNGAILGMKRREIKSKIEDIVEFSGIGNFLDTPVKRYSSGMYVRLAFSVAAYLESEILLVDEVLAVGDSNFQKKCINKMDDFSKSGKTIIFVSHNMNAITRLCSRVILLLEGGICEDGPSTKTVASYLNREKKGKAFVEWNNLDCAPGNDWVSLISMKIRDHNGNVNEIHDISKPINIEIEYFIKKPGLKMLPKLHIINGEGNIVFVTQDNNSYWTHEPGQYGYYESTLEIPGNFLSEGTYSVLGQIVTHDPNNIVHVFERDAVTFHAVESLSANQTRGKYSGHIPGIVRPLLFWNTNYKDK